MHAFTDTPILGFISLSRKHTRVRSGVVATTATALFIPAFKMQVTPFVILKCVKVVKLPKVSAGPLNLG